METILIVKKKKRLIVLIEVNIIKFRNISFIALVKRFLPMLVIYVIGMIIIIFDLINWKSVKSFFLSFLDNDKRVLIIWFTSLFIGFFHYIYITRKKVNPNNENNFKENQSYSFFSDFPFLDSIFSVTSYAIVLNSSFYLIIELIKGNLSIEYLDYISVIIVLFVLIFWSLNGLLIKYAWQIIVKCFEFSKISGFSSSTIKNITYDDGNQKLSIDFDIKILDYLNVPKELYNQFKKSQHQAKFYSEKIRNKYTLVNEDKPKNQV